MLATAPTTRTAFVGTKVAAAKNGSRVSMKAGNWLPGSTTPAYLENLPASYGFGKCACKRRDGSDCKSIAL